ncbi:hypothetical protein [Microcoleus sp. PH2017_05_CCC_O_A]|nr:hypothetical protein [Microcoleus sp. PH2017_05_CCC_O_A]
MSWRHSLLSYTVFLTAIDRIKASIFVHLTGLIRPGMVKAQ